MSELEQKVAYLHGLASGFNLNDAGPQGQLLMEIVDTLNLMADTITRIEATQDDLEEYLESMDEDLTEMEEDFYDLGDEEEIVAVNCPTCGTLIEVDSADDYDFEGEPRVDMTCPECGSTMNGLVTGRNRPKQGIER